MNINYTDKTPKNANFLLGVDNNFKSVLVKPNIISQLTTTRKKVLEYLDGKGPDGSSPIDPGKDLILTTNTILSDNDSDIISTLLTVLFGTSIRFNGRILELDGNYKTTSMYANKFKSQ